MSCDVVYRCLTIFTSGCCHSQPLLLPGGRVFVWPGIHKIQKLSLNSLTVLMESRDVYSNEGIPLTVQSTAVVKLLNEKDALQNACQLFTGMSEDQMIEFVKALLIGHMNSVIGYFTVEENYFHREKVTEKLTQMASKDLNNMGMTLLSHKVDKVKDTSGIIADILRQKEAVVNSVRRISEAEFRKQSLISQTKAQQEMELRKEELYAKELAQRADLQIGRLSNQMETSEKLAAADMTIEREAVRNRLNLQNEKLDSQIMDAATRVINQDTERIKTLSRLVQDVLETKAEILAHNSLSSAQDAKTVCESESKAAKILLLDGGTTDSHHHESQMKDNESRSSSYGTEGRKEGSEREEEMIPHNGSHNYRMCCCPSPSVDPVAGAENRTTGPAFLSNEHHEVSPCFSFSCPPIRDGYEVVERKAKRKRLPETFLNDSLILSLTFILSLSFLT